MQGGVDVNKLFGLLQEEELMESFEVELRQAYSCNHNTLSKPQEVSCSLSASIRKPLQRLSAPVTSCMCTAIGDHALQSHLWEVQHVMWRVLRAD